MDSPNVSQYDQGVAQSEKLRELPAVHEVLARLESALSRFPLALVTDEVRRVLEVRRNDIRSGAANGGEEIPVETAVEHALEALARPEVVISPLGQVDVPLDRVGDDFRRQ